MSASRSARSCWAELPYLCLGVAAAIALFSGVAMAQAPTAETPPVETTPVETTINTPDDWTKRPELAEGIGEQLAKTVDFGGLATNSGASAFVKPQTGIIYVSWLATTEPAETPEAAIRTALDQLRRSIEGMGEIAELEYREQRAGQAIEARRTWRHVANETLTMSRVLAWKSSGSQLALVRGECVFAETDREAVAPVCARALDSLSAKAIAAGAAAELGQVAAPGPAPGSEPAAAQSAGDEGPSLRAVDPENPPKVLYTGEGKDGGGSNLWLFIIGGVLIVAAFWAMTRGRREEAEIGEADRAGEEEE